MAIGVIVTLAAHASPLDIVAHYAAQAELSLAGRLVTTDVRVRDESSAPVPDLPIRITFTPVDGSRRDVVRAVSMTDRDGVIEFSTVLDDGGWTWTLDSVPDRFVELDVLRGELVSGAREVSIALEPEIIRRPGESLAFTVTVSAGDARVRRQPVSAALRCPTQAPVEMIVQTDALGRGRFAFDGALAAAGPCRVQVSMSNPAAGLTGDAVSTIRVVGQPVLAGRVVAASTLLGLVRTWRVEAQASDEHGPFVGGVYVLTSRGREIARWSGWMPAPSELPATVVDADEALQLSFFAQTGAASPLATREMVAEAPGVDPWRLLFRGAVALVLLLGAAAGWRALPRLVARQGAKTVSASHSTDTGSVAPASGVWFFEHGSDRRLRVRVRAENSDTWTRGGRWMPTDKAIGSWMIHAELDGYLPVTMQVSMSDVERGLRVNMKTWRRSVIDLLIEVLREIGVRQASESWWGKRSPTYLRRPALELARGLAPDTPRRLLDWPAAREAIDAGDLRPHEALEMLFNLADRVAFAQTDRDNVGPQAWEDAQRLADRVRRRAQEAA